MNEIEISDLEVSAMMPEVQRQRLVLESPEMFVVVHRRGLEAPDRPVSG
jgi:hypothetical protein